jgi:ABC-type transport system substrate-binding protein/class 3 adenylate cyclase
MPDWPARTTPTGVTFADLLRHHRLAAGLTQEELGAAAQLSVDAISLLERGARRHPRKDTVALLADALALADEERAAFVAAGRRSPPASLAATPPGDATADLDGHVPAADATLPHGSVTFLIAEVDDPTRLLHELSDRYAEVLAEVQALLRAVWAAHSGHELGTQGDHFFAVFAYADDALAAAASAQQALATHSWPDDAPVRLRMGLHSGAALLTAGRYVGQEVHRAACIVAAGHGGQVVVSRAVADQVAKFDDELPAGTSLRDLGKHRLEDLPHREQLYQLVLPNLPGLPASYPPLRTLDAWPGLRADLTVVVGMSAVLLTVVGLLLALVVPTFPWAIGLGAAGLAALLLLAAALAHPLRHALETQWRDARKPVAAVTSALLSLVVVSTTLFITKPPLYITPRHLGYDFSYTYHAPTHRGGAMTIGLWGPLRTLAPYFGPGLEAIQELNYGLWQGCVTQLPDTTLGMTGWRADQCTEVPNVGNTGEDPLNKWTTFHIDPRAVWSDGVPITAADFLFTCHLLADPNLGGGGYPWNQPTQCTAPDPKTVRIDWPAALVDYLPLLSNSPGGLIPIPLHAFTTGLYAGVYVPATGTYNSALAQQLVKSVRFIAALYPDNGPFTVLSFVPNHQAVVVRNPRFFSNVFHTPALDQVTFYTVNPQFGTPLALTEPQAAATLIATYRRGGVGLVDGLSPLNLPQGGGIPHDEVVTSPNVETLDIGFNQRSEAPNAQANGGMSIFGDRNVRQAFVEAFDRCAAVHAQLGISNCADPNLFTDEITTPPAPDYDPSVKLPGYNPTDAARLMDQAGYPVVDGIRRNKDGKTPLQISIDVSGGAAQAPLLSRGMQQDYERTLKIRVSVAVVRGFFADFTRGGIASQGTFDIAFFGGTGSPDPDVNAWSILGPTDTADIPSAQNPYGLNYFGVVDPWVVQQVQLAGQAGDYGQRVTVYRPVQAHFVQQFFIEPAVIAADLALVTPTLCNFKKWPEVGANLWNIADWYVAPSCPA